MSLGNFGLVISFVHILNERKSIFKYKQKTKNKNIMSSDKCCDECGDVIQHGYWVSDALVYCSEECMDRVPRVIIMSVEKTTKTK
jgi:hypothetical protein